MHIHTVLDYVHSYMHVYVHIYIYTYPHAHRQTHTYMHKYIHTSIIEKERDGVVVDNFARFQEHPCFPKAALVAPCVEKAAQ